MENMKANALVGYTGFVGSTLLRQGEFHCLYRSNNISEIIGREFGLAVCSAAPAQKWIANQDPDADRKNIMSLIEKLRTIRCERFVLISTVDVFRDPVDVDEDSPVIEDGLHPYGTNRRLLEKFVIETFSEHCIVRLSGLVGPGLRKNIIYDLHNDNDLHKIDARAVFQFYPMVNLWFDIQLALNAGLRLVHLTAEPINVFDVARFGFGRTFSNNLSATPPRYNFKTKHGRYFRRSGSYQYDVFDTIQAIRHYAQSEPKKSRNLKNA
ncbi:MAG: hypothetical protein N2578_04115 [Bdellovibrionaceae bacterium]|nr:hypothetical protein [Pseudobdellovibrionaceae bacterium]